MKGRFYLFDVLLLLLCGFFAGSASASNDLMLEVAPVSPGFAAYRESVRRGDLFLPRGANPGERPKGFIPSPVDLSHLRSADYSAYYSPARRGAAYPARYDLREHHQITSVKNQAPHNNCWAFSAIGSLESAYLKKTGRALDLSEMYLSYYAFKDAAAFTSSHEDVLQNGGFDNISVAMMARWVGPVLESAVPYNVRPTGSASGYRDRLHLQDAVFLSLQFYMNRPQPTNDVRKELIMSRGAISVNFHSSSASVAYNSDTAAWCNKGVSNLNADHSVLVIGWDDDFPKENFRVYSSPSANGAWLVRNSWGTSWGHGGYFWLSYEDSSLGDGVVFIPEETSNFDKVYGYDDLGWCANIGEKGGNNATAWMANIFTAGGEEKLQAVSFYTADANTKYEISVYTGLTNANDPKGATLAATKSGTEVFAGYHTVRLNSPVPLAKGEKFSVVVRMTTSGYGYPIAIESPVGNYSDNASVRQGESFFSIDGEIWRDGYQEKANVCLKAFTTLDSPPPADPQPGGGEKLVLSNSSSDWIRRSVQAEGSSAYTVSFSGRIDVTDGPITNAAPRTGGLSGVNASIDGIPRADAPSGHTYYTLTVEGVTEDLNSAALLGLSSFVQQGVLYEQAFSDPIPFGAIRSGGGGGGGCEASSDRAVFFVLGSLLLMLKRCGRD